MLNKSEPLLIIVVAVMLVAACSAYGYTEEWVGNIFSDGVNNSTITYDDTVFSFDHATVAGGSYIYCWTYDANVDSLTGTYVSDYVATFYSRDRMGSIIDSLLIELVDYGSYKKYLGTKETGQTGTKEGSGTWTAECTNRSFYLRGTWDTGTNIDFYYFDYTGDPDQGTGLWTRTWASDVKCTAGDGYWRLVRN
ncbi:hypothetical protein JXM67_02110 [candidate division WOR-3 bacterium]|nr:hypothetical protein [candidate division WOR-3 bacterium]